MKYTLPRFIRAAAFTLLSALCVALPAHSQTYVRLNTTQGIIDFRLYNSEAPLTTTNFLNYVRGSDYTDLLFHRSAWLSESVRFVIQAGGWTWRADGIYPVTSRGTVLNEYNVARPNVRGTVAMAKVGGQPNSATSQWFINMTDNSTRLGQTENGGYTVFARVTTPGMAVADVISNFPRVCVGDSSSCFWDEFPVTTAPVNGQIPRETSIRVLSAVELPATVATSDRIFNYLEAAYTQFVAPLPTAAGEALGYTYRYYAAADSYLGVKDGRVVFYTPNPVFNMSAPYDLGSVSDWLATAQAAGY